MSQVNELRERLAIELSRQQPTSTLSGNLSNSANLIDTKQPIDQLVKSAFQGSSLKKSQNSSIVYKKSEDAKSDENNDKIDENSCTIPKSFIKQSSQQIIGFDYLITNKTSKSNVFSTSKYGNQLNENMINFSNLKSQFNPDKKQENRSNKKNENRLYYNMDCEVENGHDNSGEQKLIDKSKKIHASFAKNTEINKHTEKKVIFFSIKFICLQLIQNIKANEFSKLCCNLILFFHSFKF